MRVGDIDMLVFNLCNPVESKFVSELCKILKNAGYKTMIAIEHYWEKEETYFSSAGRRIDLQRYLRGDPKPFKKTRYEFDYERLEETILSSRTIVFSLINIGYSRLPEPFEAAVELIAESRRLKRARENIINRYIYVYPSNSKKYPLLDKITFDLELEMLHDAESISRGGDTMLINSFLTAYSIATILVEQLRLREKECYLEEGLILGHIDVDVDRFYKLIVNNKGIIEMIRPIAPEIVSAIEDIENTIISEWRGGRK